MENKIRALLISALFLSHPLVAKGQGLTCGLEWGATVPLWSASEYNYIDSNQSRVDATYNSFSFFLNGCISGNIGVYLNDKFRLDICSGYIGIQDGRNAVPLTLRGYYFSKGFDSNSLCYRIEAGILFDQNFHFDKTYIASTGIGYRIPLYGKSAVNILGNLRFATDRPDLLTPDQKTIVPIEDIRKNISEYLSIGISVSLDF